MDGKGSRLGVDRIISGVAERQHGVVTGAQLRARGVGRGAVEGRLAKGMLRPVHRGVYAVAGRALAREGRWVAALLACRPAVLSHWDAAELWDILPPRAARDTHVSVEAHRRLKKHSGITIHRARLGEDVSARRSFRATSPARTLFDLAALLPRRRLERALDEAAYLHLLPGGALSATLERNSGRPGAVAFRALLATHRPGTTRTRSELEELFLVLCRSHGLPQPLVNARIAGLEVDFYWPSHRLVVETDGHAAHSRQSTLDRDHERDLHLRAAGYAVLRFTFRQVTERAGWVADTVRRELAT